jgi:hypothetical protein
MPAPLAVGGAITNSAGGITGIPNPFPDPAALPITPLPPPAPVTVTPISDAGTTTGIGTNISDPVSSIQTASLGSSMIGGSDSGGGGGSG